jgi:hypothetical protein
VWRESWSRKSAPTGQLQRPLALLHFIHSSPLQREPWDSMSVHIIFLLNSLSGSHCQCILNMHVPSDISQPPLQ